MFVKVWNDWSDQTTRLDSKTYLNMFAEKEFAHSGSYNVTKDPQGTTETAENATVILWLLSIIECLTGLISIIGSCFESVWMVSYILVPVFLNLIEAFTRFWHCWGWRVGPLRMFDVFTPFLLAVALRWESVCGDDSDSFCKLCNVLINKREVVVTRNGCGELRNSTIVKHIWLTQFTYSDFSK